MDSFTCGLFGEMSVAEELSGVVFSDMGQTPKSDTCPEWLADSIYELDMLVKLFLSELWYA